VVALLSGEEDGYGGERTASIGGDTEAREEEYRANGPYTGPLTVIRVQKYKIVRA
jgi:hypothetical protein